MWSKREQHQAYQFLTRRITSAMVSGEPEASEQPMRRFGMTLFSGIGVAVLVIAGFTVFGLLFPGGGKPEQNVIIREREAGALYLYDGTELHLILNMASARLILGHDAPIKEMSQASLRDIPRGAAVGISGAPASLPRAEDLIGLPWSVCTAPRTRGLESVDLATHLLPGTVPAGGERLTDAEGVLVSTVDRRELFLLWRNQRLAIESVSVARFLGYDERRALPVAPAFLDAVPAGADIRRLNLPAGQATAFSVAGSPAKVGDLFHEGRADVYYIMTAGGLVRVGHLTAQLWEQQSNQGARGITAGEAEAALDPNGVLEPPGIPDDIPVLRNRGDVSAACAAYRGDRDLEFAVSVEVYQRVPDEIPSIETPASGGRTLADRVHVPGGRGAIVSVLLPPGSAGRGTLYLITDQGIKYPLGGSNPDETKAKLGYGNVIPTEMPALFLDLLPTGVELDPDAALRLSEAPSVEPTAPAVAVAG